MAILKESRTLDQLKEAYEIEKELASRLRNAKKEERAHLYSTLYDELFQRVPNHPQLTNKADSGTKCERILPSLNLLKTFLNSESNYLEIGPGDCALAFEVSKLVKKVYAIDVSREITQNPNYPDNFELIISDGCSIPVPQNSINIAYSNQLMEHLHPEDALGQLENIYKSLIPGGKYLCVTPNRLTGPHDISKYFDEVATGFHMKEYTMSELVEIFKTVGFHKIERFINLNGYVIILPIFPVNIIEFTFLRLPRPLSKKHAQSFILRSLLGGSNIKLIATK